MFRDWQKRRIACLKKVKQASAYQFIGFESQRFQGRTLHEAETKFRISCPDEGRYLFGYQAKARFTLLEPILIIGTLKPTTAMIRQKLEQPQVLVIKRAWCIALYRKDPDRPVTLSNRTKHQGRGSAGFVPEGLELGVVILNTTHALN